jgi:hypothetical protein
MPKWVVFFTMGEQRGRIYLSAISVTQTVYDAVEGKSVSLHFAARSPALLPPRRAHYRRLGLGFALLGDLQIHLFQLANRLLENVAQNLHVDEFRRRPARHFIVQHWRTVFIRGQSVQPLAHFIRHLELVEQLVVGEQSPVILLDLQRRASLVDGLERLCLFFGVRRFSAAFVFPFGVRRFSAAFFSEANGRQRKALNGATTQPQAPVI